MGGGAGRGRRVVGAGARAAAGRIEVEKGEESRSQKRERGGRDREAGHRGIGAAREGGRRVRVVLEEALEGRTARQGVRGGYRRYYGVSQWH